MLNSTGSIRTILN